MNGEPIVIESGGGSNGGGMFGMGEGSGLFIILFLLILFGMFGNGNGFGGNRSCGNSDGGLSSILPVMLGSINSGGGRSCGTTVADQFALNNLQMGIDGIRNGQCTGTYEVVGAIKDCCCQTQGAVKDVRFDISSGLCSLGNSIQLLGRDLLENQNNGTRAILDYLANSETQRLRDENQGLRMRSLLSDQNSVTGARIDAAVAEILRRTGTECPTPAFLVNAPTPVNFPVNSCGQVQFGGNGYGNCGNGCGCGW